MENGTERKKCLAYVTLLFETRLTMYRSLLYVKMDARYKRRTKRVQEVWRKKKRKENNVEIIRNFWKNETWIIRSATGDIMFLTFVKRSKMTSLLGRGVPIASSYVIYMENPKLLTIDHNIQLVGLFFSINEYVSTCLRWKGYNWQKVKTSGHSHFLYLASEIYNIHVQSMS